MWFRFALLCSLACAVAGGAVCVGARDARGQMTVRDVPLEQTAAWKTRMSMLRAKNGPGKIPPLRLFEAGQSLGLGEFAQVPPEWRDRIRKASTRHGVEEALLAAVLKAESDFNPFAVSPKGARGAMQIMPATGRELGLHNFFDPEANLDAGASYLALLLREFADPELALAAYNAGPEAVRRHRGLPPYEETRVYVERVLALFARYRASISLP